MSNEKALEAPPEKIEINEVDSLKIQVNTLLLERLLRDKEDILRALDAHQKEMRAHLASMSETYGHNLQMYDLRGTTATLKVRPMTMKKTEE